MSSSQRRVARRYAKGLFAYDQGNLGQAKKHLGMLQSLNTLFDDKNAGAILRSPVMPTDLKRELLSYGLKQTGADESVTAVVHAIVDAGRVPVLPDVAQEFSSYIDEAEGVVKADVVSAVPLESTDIDAIASNVSRLLKKKVEVKPSIDPSLLGGFVVRVGNYRIDMSLKTKLDGLSHSAAQDSLR